MNNQFSFFVSTHLKFGTGISEKLGEEILSLGAKNVLVIMDKAVSAHPQLIKSIESIKTSGISCETVLNEYVEPTYDQLEEFRGKLSGKKIDLLVGIGGGSALDLTKGMAVLLTNEGPALSFRGFPKFANRPIPIIAIPTTAGTGSEVTYNAVFTDSKEKKKLGINSTLNFPVRAFIDPLITVNCPKSVAVSSGCDALVHTLESFVHKNNTPLSRMYSIMAFKLIFNGLAKVLKNPADVNIRGDIALGAYLAGIALINSGSGPSGAFSYPLGAVYKVPHGYAGAIFLSSITKHNVKKGYKDYAVLYDLIEGSDNKLDIGKKNEIFAEKIQQLMDSLDVPKSLKSYGLGPKDIEFMINQYDVLKAAIAQNPIEIAKEDAAKILSSLA